MSAMMQSLLSHTFSAVVSHYAVLSSNIMTKHSCLVLLQLKYITQETSQQRPLKFDVSAMLYSFGQDV